MGRRIRQRGTRGRGRVVGLLWAAAAGMAAVVVVLAIVLVRSGAPPTAVPAPEPAPGAPEAAAPPRPGAAPVRALPDAPDVSITMYQGEEVVGGERVMLSRLWQAQPVVLNFFAGLCPPCRAEMPDFQRVWNARSQEGFVLLSLDIGPFIGLGSREEGKALLRELGISFPAGTTFDESAVFAYRILGMPTTAFITPQGKILRKHTGLLTRSQMEAFITELLRAGRR